MTATRKQHSTKPTRVLYLAFELSWNEWKLAFATGPGDNPRLRSIGGRNTAALVQEIAKAKKRFGLAADAPVHSCYEAGRDGFWLHRFLDSQSIANLVVDSSSIEVQRRGRRRKTDRLDATKLLSS
jgi:transposase